MFFYRNPWVVALIVILIAVGAFFAVVFSRSSEGSLDAAALLGPWFTYIAVFVVLAVVAVIAYRSLRRSRSPAALDEARSKKTP